MPLEVRIPKIVQTDLVRQRMGDARYEKWLLEVFGRDLFVKVKPETLSKTLAELNGESNGKGPHMLTLAVRVFLTEQPRVRKKLVAWLEAKIDEDLATTATAKPDRRVDGQQPKKRGRPRGRKVAR